MRLILFLVWCWQCPLSNGYDGHGLIHTAPLKNSDKGNIYNFIHVFVNRCVYNVSYKT